MRLKSAPQTFNIPLISEGRQFWRMQPNALVLGIWGQVLRAAFDGRRRISVRGPVSFLPVAGGQVLSRAFLPQRWGEQQGAGGRGPAHPFLLPSLSFREPSSPPCWPRGTSPVGAVSGTHLLFLQDTQGKSVGSLENRLCLMCHREAEVAALCLWGCVALDAPPGEVTWHLQASCWLGMQEKRCLVEAQ